MTKQVARYAHLDLLRAISILLVLVAHAGLGDVIPGGSGVTIFFCISGFVITHLVLKERTRTAAFDIRGFYLRRVIKIAPPLILLILVPTLVFSSFFEINWFHVLGEVFFFFNWIYLTGESAVLPGSGVVWSLSIEEQFYIVFAVLWLILAKMRKAETYLAWAASAVVIYSNVARLFFAIGESAHNRVYYGSDTRMDAIALGVLAAIWLKKLSENSNASAQIERRKWDIYVVVALATFLVSLLIRDEWFRNTLRFSLQSFATVVIILFGFLKTNSFLSRCYLWLAEVKWLRYVGLSSYSIYLCHLIIFNALSPLTEAMPLTVSITLKVISGLAIGLACYFAVEVPALKLKALIRIKDEAHQSKI